MQPQAWRHGTSEEFVRLHADAENTVAALGFSPGFPYLTGLPQRLELPGGKRGFCVRDLP